MTQTSNKRATLRRVRPTFLLIGAQKSATSWLAAMLRQHPDVFTPQHKKELHFFNIRDNYEKGIEWYLNQFAGYSGETAVGECTPNYLWVADAPELVQADRNAAGKSPITFQEYPHVIKNIPELVYRHFSDVKLIACLRNPVNRAISSFYHAIRARKISPRCHIMDVGGEQGILGMGFYHRHLSEWMKFFPKDRFLILVYEEDIVRNKEQTLQRVYQHLGVDTGFVPQNLTRRYNVHSSHAYMYLNYYLPNLANNRLLRRASRFYNLNYPKVKITPSEILQLKRLYEAENKRLEETLNRSLDFW